MAQLVSMKDIQVEDAERCTLASSSVVVKYLSPLRVLDSQGWPNLGRDSHWTPDKSVSQVHLSDFCVPMLSLGVLGLDDFTQVRWGPEIPLNFLC